LTGSFEEQRGSVLLGIKPGSEVIGLEFGATCDKGLEVLVKCNLASDSLGHEHHQQQQNQECRSE
jgi:hypothetical protein